MNAPTSQFAYLRRLIRLLGVKDALRFRWKMLTAGPGADTTLQLHPRTLCHPVALRLGSTDAEVYHQVLRQAEYAAVCGPDTGQPNTPVIVDCGANCGYTSAYFLSRYPNARLIAIEPFPANAAMCRRNLAPYGDRATVIEAAIWSARATLVLDHAGGGNEWGVSVRAARPGETGGITAIDIASLALPRIDILKIDIEGSEAAVFAPGTTGWLGSVGNIAIELHGPVCEANFHAALAGFHYIPSQSGELTIRRDIRRRD